MAAALIGYVVVTYLVAFVAARNVKTLEDFVVAGRRLPLSLAWMTLLATWFGAGTLLAVSDEVHAVGLQAAGLDPIGAGCCLLFVGLFVAGPMWSQRLLTVPDFFGRRFGRPAELVSSWILVPSYFGWIAAQFVAVANMLHLYFGTDVRVGIVTTAIVGGGYTLLGGMWSVAITDAIQIGMVLIGLILLLVNVLSTLGEGFLVDGWHRVIAETPSSDLIIIPTEDIGVFMGWLGIFVTGALGNVPVQDLMQRVFASNSERTARRACIIAGFAYLTFGAIPIFLALATRILLPDVSGDVILLQLARTVFTPAMSTVFVLCVLSAVASTIDSAILSPSTVLAQNVFGERFGPNGIARNRLAIVVVTAMSILFALSGESAYALLEQSYELTLVGLFLPLMIGIYVRRVSSKATLACMLSGTSVWLIHVTLGADQFGEPIPLFASAHVPRSIGCTIIGGFVYLLARRIEKQS